MKKTLTAVLMIAVLACAGWLDCFAEGRIPAFPGAEGGGKYTLGARASGSPEVYHVTSLAASGSGSFAEAVSKPNRIIVFDVGGTIQLKNTLKIASSNLTILGQTAPGDGITIAGGDVLLSSGVSNIILRYLRIRPSDQNGREPPVPV